jgi:hypothetical protein
LTISPTLPAIAGGDRQSDQLWNREQARRAKLAQMDQEVVPQAPTLKSGPAANPQQTDKDVQMDNMTKACAEMMNQPA